MNSERACNKHLPNFQRLFLGTANCNVMVDYAHLPEMYSVLYESSPKVAQDLRLIFDMFSLYFSASVNLTLSNDLLRALNMLRQILWLNLTLENPMDSCQEWKFCLLSSCL